MGKANIPELVPFGNFLLAKHKVDAVVTSEDLAEFEASAPAAEEAPAESEATFVPGTFGISE